MKGGLFLEMLGLEHAHVLQRSFAGNTEMDRCCSLALRDLDRQSWVGDFLSVISNDERQFNAPGVRVPMVSLSRVLPRDSPDWPFRNYHSDQDRPEAYSPGQLEESRQVVLGMIDVIEGNLVPVRLYKGVLFLSRYGLHIDACSDEERHGMLVDILDSIDGTRTVVDIAEACDADFKPVKATIDELQRHGLVRYLDPLFDSPEC